ncbi:MAG: hypothetical protein WEA56_02530 [Balneolaceae bacterium]
MKKKLQKSSFKKIFMIFEEIDQSIEEWVNHIINQIDRENSQTDN